MDGSFAFHFQRLIQRKTIENSIPDCEWPRRMRRGNPMARRSPPCCGGGEAGWSRGAPAAWRAARSAPSRRRTASCPPQPSSSKRSLELELNKSKFSLPYVYLTKPPLLLFRHGLPPVGALLLEVGEDDDLVGIVAFVLLTTGLQDGRSVIRISPHRPAFLLFK